MGLDSPFVISLRNPIDRFVSTFNFLIQERLILLKNRSYKVYQELILKDKGITEEENILKYLKDPIYKLWRDSPEHIDLSRYDYDVCKFAENLYDSSGTLISCIAKAPENIKTLYEDLHYYYDKIINDCRSNIEGDAKRIINIDIPHTNNKISQLAYTNLTKFLESDFIMLKKMQLLDIITEKQYNDLQVCKSYTNVTPDDLGTHRNLHGTLRFVANVYETRHSIKKPPTHRFIHIGKCGGSSIRAALVSKQLLKHPTGYISEKDYNLTRSLLPLDIEWIHCNRTYIDDRLSNYVCLRNPIDRFVSAFNWIYYRVTTPTYAPNLYKCYVNCHPTVEDFAFYDNDVNKMAEQLYDDDGTLNEKAHAIITGPPMGNQMSWDITFYLEELVNSEIEFVGVIAFPTLNEDTKHHLGIELGHFKKNQVGNKTLSETGYRNLRRYLDTDFQCIEVLYKKGYMTEKQFNDLNVCYSIADKDLR